MEETEGATDATRSHKRMKITASVLILIVVLGGIETVSYVFGKHYLAGSPLSFIVYARHYEFGDEEVANYFSRRDPLLGWPPLDAYGTEYYDLAGARPSPTFPPNASACVSLYGDSYTYSTAVDGPADAWGNLLSERLRCRVANYGVAAYGTDQAFLRYRENPNDDSDIVIMGVTTVDILRIVNQDRRLIWGPDSGLAFKPRFVVSPSGGLEDVAIPDIRARDIPQYVGAPEAYLLNEWFLPDSEGGPVTFEPPYSLALVRGLISERVLAKLLGKPSWLGFYAEEHGSGALPLLLAILDEFGRTAEVRGQRPIVLIIPTSQDLWYMRKTGANPVASLLDGLTDRELEYVDLTPTILERLGDRDICDIFARDIIGNYCWGHYNNEGDGIIASLVFEHLQGRGPVERLGN